MHSAWPYLGLESPFGGSNGSAAARRHSLKQAFRYQERSPFSTERSASRRTHNGTIRKGEDTQLTRLISLFNCGSPWGARQEAKVMILHKRGINFSQEPGVWDRHRNVRPFVFQFWNRGIPRVRVGMSQHRVMLRLTHKMIPILQVQLGRKMKDTSLECAHDPSRLRSNTTSRLALTPLLDMSTCASPMPWRKGLVMFSTKQCFWQYCVSVKCHVKKQLLYCLEFTDFNLHMSLYTATYRLVSIIFPSWLSSSYFIPFF